MKFAIKTYGCRANHYDSEAIRELLVSSGATEVESIGDADIAVFNSCTVTAAAEAELRKDVRRAATLRPGLQTIVSGCAAAIPDRDEARHPLRSLPSVVAVVPGADLDAVAAAAGVTTHLGTLLTRRQSGARALLRIQDGCDEHCTFCATTIARGASRSHPINAVLDEATILAESHPEIVITGIHIGSYGNDCHSSLGELMQTLIERIPRVRFRLTSIEATEIDERLLELFAEANRLAPHIHAPLQSGSNRILRRMGRHWYTAESYRHRIEDLVSRHEIFGLAADVIAGFPGETADDHTATMRLIEDLPFTSLHVFPYSPRPGTAAIRLGHHVPPNTVGERAAALRHLAKTKAAAYSASRIGGPADTIVTSNGHGLTGDYLSVTVPEQFRRRDRFTGTLALTNGEITALPA